VQPKAVVTNVAVSLDVLRRNLMELLDGGAAHMSLDEAVAEFPLDATNRFPPNVTYTPWHLVEHLRLTQRDILDFIVADAYEERRWPDDFWPPSDSKTDADGWQRSLTAFREDLAAMRALVADPDRELLTPVRSGYDQTLAREAMLTADHNAYHVGEFAILRQVMGTWPEDRDTG
jgi:hypothetical protein